MLLLHFLRLMRFGNLMVIGVTMCIVQAFIAQHGNCHYCNSEGHFDDLTYKATTFITNKTFAEEYLLTNNFDLDFFLLILSVVLIAGAGNIINDYFDIKADRVNKPHKMVVEKHIKRRWAIVWNWVFNTVGLLISIYLSWKYSNIWIALIAFLTINFLWFYSALYKRKIFVGNIIIAFLVGLVPLYVLIYNSPLKGFKAGIFDLVIDYGAFFTIKVIVIIGTIAFVINLMREIIKDMADIRGDLHLDASTIPISLGIKKTKIILVLLLIPLLTLMAYYISDIMQTRYMSAPVNFALYDHTVLFENFTWFLLFVIMSGLICISAFVILLTSNKRKRYLLASNLLKLAMLFGMVSPLFL